MKKTLALLMTLLLLTVSLPAGAQTNYPRFITIGGGGTGAALFAIATNVAQIITDNLPIQANGQASNGGTHNLQLIQSGEYEMGMADNASVYAAYTGTGVFEGKANPDLRSICSIYQGFFAVQARTGVGIETVADLRGKKVAVGMPNSGTENVTRAVFGAEGYDYTNANDIVAEFVGASSGTDLIRNRQADAMTFLAPVPDAVQTELVISAGTTPISLSDGAIAALTVEGMPYVAGVIPAGTYEGQTKDVQTVYVPMYMCVSKDMDEQVVYEITKLIFDNLDTLRLAHNAFAKTSLETATAGLVAPLHPGAERYFREMGVIE